MVETPETTTTSLNLSECGKVFTPTKSPFPFNGYSSIFKSFVFETLIVPTPTPDKRDTFATAERPLVTLSLKTSLSFIWYLFPPVTIPTKSTEPFSANFIVESWVTYL